MEKSPRVTFKKTQSVIGIAKVVKVTINRNWTNSLEVIAEWIDGRANLTINGQNYGEELPVDKVWESLTCGGVALERRHLRKLYFALITG